MNVIFSIKTLCGKVGGAENVFLSVINYLVSLNWKITIITFDNNETLPFYDVPKVKWLRLNIGCTQNPSSLIDFILQIYHLRKEILKIKFQSLVMFVELFYLFVNVVNT